MATPAPGELELVRRFVNTWDVENDPAEGLPTPAALRDWLVENGVLQPGTTAGPSDLGRAVALRDALRALLRANHDDGVDAQASAVLEAAARRAQLSLRFGAGDGPGTARLEPLAGGVDGALGWILARVAAAIGDGTWRRLKICPADDCQFAFYDTSRNRSGVWCSMKVCGNRAKVRSFRERQA